jgi:hypothetical protein
MKAILIIILLIGAAFGIPSIRNRIVGPLDPVLSKLGPAGEKIQNPARRYKASQEATAITRKLTDERSMRRPMPSPPRFPAWVQANMRSLEIDGLDPWGHPYYYIQTRQEMTVGSVAQDGVRDTPDDVRVTAPLK